MLLFSPETVVSKVVICPCIAVTLDCMACTLFCSAATISTISAVLVPAEDRVRVRLELLNSSRSRI